MHHQTTTALDSYRPGRLRRGAITAPDHGTSAAAAFNWLADLAGDISASAAPSMMFVQGEAVVVDTSDFRLSQGTEAVVLNHDGTLGIDRVEHRHEDPAGERRGWGAWRPSMVPGASTERPGVTILGKVIARSGGRLRAA